MKILYIFQYFSLPSEAGGTRAYDLAMKFLEAGHEVEFITLSTNLKPHLKKGQNVIEYQGLKLHVLDLDYDNSMPYFKRIIVFLRFIWLASFKALNIKCDIVLATSTPLTIGIPALIKKKLHKTPFIFEARDVWPEAVIAIGAVKNKLAQKSLYKLESTIYRNASAIVPLSIDMRASINKRFPYLTCPVVCIENISALQRFNSGFNPEKLIINERLGIQPRFSIVYAGTFGRVNGIHYVVHLAQKLYPIDPSIVFILIGDGNEKDSVIKLAEKAGILNKNIFVLDPVPKNELPQWYYECQMGSSFVIPIKELWANSANKFFDTLAAGRPVLINHEGWQKEVLQKNDAGYVLPHNLEDIDGACIERFVEYTKNKKWQRKQQESSKTLAEDYSLKTASKKYLKLLKQI